MSAFICNDPHITALAVYAARNRLAAQADAKAIGDILHAENVKSVNYRYGEATTPGFNLCEWAAFHPFSRAQIVKAAVPVVRASRLGEKRGAPDRADDHRRRPRPQPARL